MLSRFNYHGLLLALAFTLVHLSAPGADYPWFAIIWPLPIIVATRSLTPFRSAMVFGACCWAIWLYSVWWLLPAIISFTQTTVLISTALLLAVTFSCALPYALAAYLWRYLTCRRIGDKVFFPAVVFTAALSWLPSLLPGTPFHGLYRLPILIQTLGIGGFPLLVFILLVFNFSLVSAFDSIINSNKNQKKSLFYLVNRAQIPILLSVFVLSYGAIKLHYHHSASSSNSLYIAFVQPNLTRADNTSGLFAASQKLGQAVDDLDLIVWPEFPPAFSVIDNPEDKQKISDLSRAINTPLLVNSGYVYRRAADGRKLNGYYNSNQLIMSGTVIDSYHKQLLVPFFEYLPFVEQWPKLKQYFPETLQYTPGDSSNLLALNRDSHLITTICYEVIFSSMVRKFVDIGGNIIVNPVNDRWLGDSKASAQHFALALFKTVEFNIPLIRVANSGISAIVAASGEIEPHTETKIMTTAVRSGRVVIPDKRSFYALNGDIFLYIISIVVVFYGLRLLLYKKPSTY